jgi:hypothetical protein
MSCLVGFVSVAALFAACSSSSDTTAGSGGSPAGAGGATGGTGGVATGGTGGTSGTGGIATGGTGGVVTGGSGGIATGGSGGVATGGSGGTGGIATGGTGGVATGGTGGVATGGTGGVATGGTGGVATGGSSGTGGSLVDASLPPDAGNFVPAGYTGTPFVTTTIPGFVYAADYDKGGPAVGFCHNGNITPTPTGCAGGIHLTDWCCSANCSNGTCARCDNRSQSMGPCPLYRQNADNAGICHMNLGEVDTFSTAGPTWVAGPNGPTLTGPNVTVGTPVPQHADTTTQEDVYICYVYTSQWSKHTVQVLQAGTYSIGGLMGVPAGTTFTLDFGNNIKATISPPASPVTPECRCIEAYHAWTNYKDLGTVTFPAAGTYLMTFTVTAQQFNPLYFTFTKQ